VWHERYPPACGNFFKMALTDRIVVEQTLRTSRQYFRT